MLSFIHLSDIHFQKYSGDAYDLDADLRNELLIDLSKNLPKSISAVNGILICGDIAFSAQESEYAVATDFLEEICQRVSLDPSRVFCVPGNHDVDQGVTRGSRSLRALQQDLATAEPQEAEKILGQLCRNPLDARILCASIEHYNTFATKYHCGFAPNILAWEQDMSLDDTHTLCIIGMNSTLISSERDHVDDSTEQPMRLSLSQIPKRRTDTIFLSLCHHPPTCWIDPEGKLQNKMDARVAVQLYGHKHLQTVRQTEHSIAVGSGAAHPVRTEKDWIPRYNWITLKIGHKAGTHILKVRIYPRVLNKKETAFIADPTLQNGQNYLEYDIWGDGAEDIPVGGVYEKVTTMHQPEAEKSMGQPFLVESWERTFIYDFMNLPFYARKHVVEALSLDRPEDVGKSHSELLDRYIERTKAIHQEKKLLEQVQAEKRKVVTKHES